VTRMHTKKDLAHEVGRIRERLDKVKFWDDRDIYRVRGKTNHVKVERHLINKCNYKFG